MLGARHPLGSSWVLAIALAFVPVSSDAQVTRIDISSRADVLGGRAFGLAGGYEKLSGTVHFALDPESAANQGIVDVALAPRNGSGRVEFAADLYVLKPKDPSRGNGAILFDVVNRGNKVAIRQFHRDARGSADPTAERDLGDGFLMEQGFTVVWIGWQFNLPPGPGVMRVDAPVATEAGKPIEGPVRYWWRTDEPTPTQSLDDLAGGRHYPVVNPGSDRHRLTVREGDLDEPRSIPRSSWTFSDDAAAIELPGGFEPGRLYEITYWARDPAVAGLGFAAVRDAISHLRHDSDLLGDIDAAYAFGNSQSGRFLRGFLHDGFNADLDGRIVFDGVIAHVSASIRDSFNQRFAQPGIAGPARFPFSDVVQTDPVTGQRGGLLDRATATRTVPKLFLVNTSNEYWTEWKAAAMVHTSIDGTRDLQPSENVRIYTIAGAQHGSGSFPPGPAGSTRYMRNVNDYNWALRALLVAMDAWHRNGSPPPESRHPMLADGTLVAFDALRFPTIPGVVTPKGATGTFRWDEGARAEEGIIDKIPPGRGAPFPVLLPQVDADGNELGGIRLPVIAVPLATNTGWNLRHPDTGGADQLARLSGSYLPFPKTASERRASGDPRLSIEERYASRSEYVGLVTEAALDLVDDGFVLAGDVPGIVRDAITQWEYAQTH